MLVWWLIPVLAIVAAGFIVFLIILGLRGRYVGGEPRCRRCTYQLTGIQSQRCPECGSVLDDRGVVYGLRKRRWVVLATALLLWGIWVSGHEYYWGSIRRIQWIQLTPFAKVLRDARNGDFDGLREIERRSWEGGLSERQQSALAEAVFEKDGQTLTSGDTKKWSSIRESLETADALDDDQKQRAYARFAETTMHMRSPIRQGDPLVILLQYKSARSAIFTSYGFWEIPTEVRAAGRVVLEDADETVWREARPDWWRSQYRQPGAKVIPLDAGELPVGLIAVEYSGRQVLGRWLRGSRQRRLVWSREMSLASEVEVLPADAPDPVVVVDDQDARDELHEAVTIHLNEDPRSVRAVFRKEEQGEASLDLHMKIHNPTELTLAFDIVVRAGDRELPVKVEPARRFAWLRPARLPVCRPDDTIWLYLRLTVPVFDEDQITLVLRSDPDRARYTPDVFRVLGGELTFGPYEVEYDEE